MMIRNARRDRRIMTQKTGHNVRIVIDIGRNRIVIPRRLHYNDISTETIRDGGMSAGCFCQNSEH